ncbi:MAG: hypothetical protein J6Q32_01095 [Clostridia bacterium]|nr:hypothetical protein [Clostridia bacterium]
MGKIEPQIIDYLAKHNISIGKSEIELKWTDLEHSVRDEKKEIQLLSPDQVKRIEKMIKENNVFFDNVKQNIIYISELSPDEINGDRDWVKIPVNLHRKNGKNLVATMSIIPKDAILKNNENRYEKID